MSARRKRRSATVAEAAALNFEPFDFDGWELPGNEQWDAVLPMVHIASRFVGMTKSQLIAALRKLPDEAVRDVGNNMAASVRLLDATRALVGSANARILVAISTIVAEEGRA